MLRGFDGIFEEKSYGRTYEIIIIELWRPGIYMIITKNDLILI